MSNLPAISKKTKWTSRTTVGLGHIQSIIDLRRHQSLAFANRLFSTHSKDDTKDNCHIVINISGMRFETFQSTLEHYPATLLGSARRRSLFYDKTREEYFFDRHRLCFEAILYYYQSQGRLRRPPNVPLDTFLEEIIFFDLGSDALKQVQQAENIEEAQKVVFPKNRFCRRVWTILEYPEYSITAKIVNLISLFFILLSAVGLAVETLPSYHPVTYDQCQHEADGLLISTNLTYRDRRCPNIFNSPFYIIQIICIAFFTLEFILRIATCPSYFKFIKCVLNWIDLLAIAPFYIRLGIILVRVHYEIDSNVYLVLRLLRIIRFIRIFKLYRVFKSIKSLRILASTLKESLLDFIIILTFLSLSGFLFGAAFYFAENGTNAEMFDSIPKATYYGIMTITAVGYGDLSPVTPLGRALASLCAIFGISVVSMLVSVLAERYQRVYTRKLFLNEQYADNLVFEDDENRDSTSSNIDYQASISNSDDNPPDFQEITNEDEPVDEKGPITPKEEKIQFVIGFLSDDDLKKDKELMMTEVIKELLRTKLGKQCSVSRTDVFI